MPNRLIAVELDGRGVFFARAHDRAMVFSYDGRRLTTETVPDGCWPFAYEESSDERTLYFHYFLSSTLHRWRLTEDGARFQGAGVDREGLAALIANLPEGPDADWIGAKLSDAGLDLQAAPRPASEFCRRERAVLAAMAEGRLRAFALGEVGSPEALDPQTARHCLTPAGYRDPVAVRGAGFFAADAWDYLTNGAAGFDFQAVAEIQLKLFRELNPSPKNHFSKFMLGGFEDIPGPECVRIEYSAEEAKQRADSHACLVFRLFLPKIFMRSTPEGVASNSSFVRIQHSLLAIQPYLLRLTEERDRFSLDFSFGDAGFDGCISFDRPAGSSRPLLTDLYMLAEIGRARVYPLLRPELFAAAFMKKRPLLFWRGATTGSDIPDLAALAVNPRVRACMTIRQQLPEAADCKISSLVQCLADPEEALALLRREGVWGERSSEDDFGRYQLFIDLPGNCAAWGSFLKYLVGCAVIRPVPATRELAYHGVLVAGEDFLPVRPDLADIGEVVEAALADPERTAAIAYSGRRKVIEFMRDVAPHTLSLLEAAAR